MTELSDRQVEVLGLVAEGLTSEQIATRMYLSDSTVRNHLQEIYNKLGASGRAQAVSIGFHSGVLKAKGTASLTPEEKHALAITLKFRITQLADIELQMAREQIDLLVSAAQKLELP